MRATIRTTEDYARDAAAMDDVQLVAKLIWAYSCLGRCTCKTRRGRESIKEIIALKAECEKRGIETS